MGSRSGTAGRKVGAGWVLVGRFEIGGHRYIIAREDEPAPRCVSRLTTREREVVRLAAAGRSAKSIAYDLGIASSTVRVLLARAARKTGEKAKASTAPA